MTEKTMRIREDIASTTGVYFAMGTHKNKDHAVAKYDPSLTRHLTSNPYAQQGPDLAGGLGTTKFGKGFQRRPKELIQNVFADEEKRASDAYQQTKSHRVEQANRSRSELLKTVSNRTGYDIITGNQTGSQIPKEKPQGIRPVAQYGLSNEAPMRGHVVLRETEGRFFTPHGSGHTHEYRQKVLYKEGLLTEKYTGILDSSKKDMISYGVEDQFSKSEYHKNSATTQNGLYETRIPGRFTPRKIAGNPSGNPHIVEGWHTNIDLNNRTLKGIL